jgi:hypothetical protein
MKRITSQVDATVPKLTEFLLAIVIVLACFGAPASGQYSPNTQNGTHVVSNSAGSGTTTSGSVIDASVQGGSDICQEINSALQKITGPGFVVDARGVPGQTAVSMTCTGTETPWLNGNTYIQTGATILLPAGTITIPVMWNLANHTRLIGMGPGITTIAAASTLTGAQTMIQMAGGGSPCPQSGCTGVTVEQLSLKGNSSTSLVGIYNNDAGQGSYVDHVSISNVLGTGVSVVNTTGIQGLSGPYSNITFNDSSTSSTGVCLQISGSTLGVRGLTCISADTSSQTTAIYIDGSNNTIADVYIQGFYDGIKVGSNSMSSNDIFRNISDGTPVQQENATVEIGYLAEDIVLMGLQNSGHKSTVADDRTATTLMNPTIAMYVLGHPIPGNNSILSRFTTSVPSIGSGNNNAPTWVVGNSAPPTTTTCVVGSLYSNTSTSGDALYLCTASAQYCTQGGSCWTGVD